MRITKLTKFTCSVLLIAFSVIMLTGCSSSNWATHRIRQSERFQFAYTGKTWGSDNWTSNIEVTRQPNGDLHLNYIVLLVDKEVLDGEMKSVLSVSNAHFAIRILHGGNTFYSRRNSGSAFIPSDAAPTRVFHSRNSHQVVAGSFFMNSWFSESGTTQLFTFVLDETSDLTIEFEYVTAGWVNHVYSFTFQLSHGKFK
jgi:hypothetical protein